jgi:GNAT superfamily N-acetyltransferase
VHVTPIVAMDTEGHQTTVRAICPADRVGLLSLGEEVSERTLDLRFFSISRFGAQRYLGTLAEGGWGSRCVLVAEQHGALVGVAAFDLIDEVRAELSAMVSDSHQHCGVGTLLIETLISEARGRGITAFVAEVSIGNADMLQVLRDLGLRQVSTTTYGCDTITINLAETVQHQQVHDRWAIGAAVRQQV